jgi:hypothetical protein
MPEKRWKHQKLKRVSNSMTDSSTRYYWNIRGARIGGNTSSRTDVNSSLKAARAETLTTAGLDFNSKKNYSISRADSSTRKN